MYINYSFISYLREFIQFDEEILQIMSLLTNKKLNKQ
jgi:hypothetical protein